MHDEPVSKSVPRMGVAAAFRPAPPAGSRGEDVERPAYPVELLSPDGGLVSVRVRRGERIRDAALRHGVTMACGCCLGWCLECAGRVLAGSFEDADCLRVYPEDRRAGFILLCTASPLGPMTILTGQREAMAANRRRHGLPVPDAGRPPGAVPS